MQKYWYRSIEHVLQFTAQENQVFMRSYKIGLKKSGGRIPPIELEEIGPSIDWKGTTIFISLILPGLAAEAQFEISKL